MASPWERVTSSADNAADFSGQFGLMYYLFPPLWWPTFAMGTCAAFLFDAHRPYLSARAYLWGYLVDLMTVGLIATSISYIVFSSCIQKARPCTRPHLPSIT